MKTQTQGLRLLQTVRYTDEAIGQFIDDLKAAGLYDNTVIALYGDHHGLNCGMEDIKESVSRFIGREYDYDEMLNVRCLFIYQTVMYVKLFILQEVKSIFCLR